MAHTTFRGETDPIWKQTGGNNGPGPTAADSKVRHSSTGPEREMRREMTKTEEQARAKHAKQDAQQHPGFAKPTEGMP